MSVKVGLIGHCGPDASYLRLAVSKALPGSRLIAADDIERVTALVSEGVDLLLINRVLDFGFENENGLDLIASLRTKHPNLRMMLISNFPEAQDAAVKVGALPGFGKRQLGSPQVTEMLRAAVHYQTAPSQAK